MRTSWNDVGHAAEVTWVLVPRRYSIITDRALGLRCTQHIDLKAI